MSTTATHVTVQVPLAIRRRPGRKTVVVSVAAPGGAAVQARTEPALVKALEWAYRYQRLLDEGRYASISGMAAAERIERAYLSNLLQLTLLAPDIVEAVPDGRQPAELGLLKLLEPLATEGEQQRLRL